MSLLRVGALILPLLLLVTWLTERGMNAEIPVSNDALRALDDYASIEGRLHRDVLAARAGILRNYDPLVQELNAMRQAIIRLNSATTKDPVTRKLANELAIIVSKKEHWTEQFKSRNSLLQNSLGYFDLFSKKLTGVGENSDLAKEVSNLSTAMLHLTLDTSPAVIEDVDLGLKSVSTDTLSERQSRPVQALLAHGIMLRNMLPETNDLLKQLLSLTTDHQLEALRGHISAQRAVSEKRARLFRYLLYVLSLILVGLLACFGVGLQSRARELRWRANIEHLIAKISTRFINSQFNDLKSTIEQALEELAQYLNADRAYFITAGPPQQAFVWSRPEISFPTNWPESVENVSKYFGNGDDGIIHFARQKHRFQKNELQEFLPADVRTWLCVRSLKATGVDCILGFEALKGDRDMAHSKQFGLVRMAFDAIAYAIERDNNEHEKKQFEASLQRARRMETIGAFASGIAHNFNNIVGAILGYSELAYGHVKEGGAASRNLVEIHRAGERARGLIDQILKFGRRAELKRERVSLNTLLAETKSLLVASLPSNIDLTVREAPSMTVVEVDATQLQQVILNICNNAAQAIEQTGTIEISIDNRDPRDNVNRLGLGPGRHAMISIADNGRGMDKATHDRIFEPFFTTRTDGNGLGLSTANEIIREHGGRIYVQSRQGSGSRFDIWIPCAPAGKLPDNPRWVQPVRFGNGETLLVLEADSSKLLHQEEILAALGYEPIGYTKPDEAISALRKSPSRFDLILICGANGASSELDIANIFRKAAIGLPIVLITVSTEQFGAASLAAAGVSQLVSSSFASLELANALNRSLSVPISA